MPMMDRHIRDGAAQSHPSPTKHGKSDHDRPSQPDEDRNSDADIFAYWQRKSAEFPPLDAEQVAAVAAIVRRIDQRRGPTR
jgi:hypothetical protein